MPQPSHPSFDVAVVGGGIIGLAVGWRAAQRGMRVVVLERDAPGSGATHAAAGMLAPASEANLAERDLLALGLASAARFPAFVAELREVAGVDPGFLPCGTLVVARDRDEAEALERERRAREELGLDVARLRPSEARRREPALAPTLRLALDVPDDHAVDPRALAAALAAAVPAAGGEVRAGAAVARVDVADGRVAGVTLAGGERVAAGQVVVAAGAWTGALAGLPEDARVPVRPVKGQILRLRDPAGPGLLQRVVRMERGYLVPRGDGRYVLGATMEERGFDTDVTAGAVSELLRDAGELVPGIAELVLEELEAGLRPGTPDNAPALGPSPAVAGLHWAAGHHRNGILLTPITAELVAAGLAGEPLGELAAPFSPARFADGTARGAAGVGAADGTGAGR